MLNNTDVNAYCCCTFNGCTLVVHILIQTLHSVGECDILFIERNVWRTSVHSVDKQQSCQF